MEAITAEQALKAAEGLSFENVIRNVKMYEVKTYARP
jgi:hypothetical protein